MKRAEAIEHYHQRGSAMILSIMMMMSLGLLVLTTLGQHLSGALSLTANEHHYLSAWEYAQSSLNWGIRQSWAVQPDSNWHCQQGRVTAVGLQKPFNSCLRPSLRKGIFLLKGEGKAIESRQTVILFQQVTATKASDGHYALTALKQGWLDFCPESDLNYCDTGSMEVFDAKGI